MRRRRLTLLVAAGSVAALIAAGYGYLALISRDAPAPASLDTAPVHSGGGPLLADGVWSIAPVPTNFVGYRIRERLGPVAAPSDAVARTSEVSGSANIDGSTLTTLDISVVPASLDSGSGHRDEFVRDEALDVERYPTAEFHLDEPVEIGAPVLGLVMDLSLPGRLTLRGESVDVTFAVQARWNGPTIQAAGTTTVHRGDFGIDVSSRAGFNIDEKGAIEFELTFTPDGTPVDSAPPTLVDNTVSPTDEGEFRPPCQSDEPVVLHPPVLVTAATDTSTTFEVVRARGDQLALHASSGLTGGSSWSPDGTEIVYSSSTSLAEPRTLSIAPASGQAPTPVPGLSNVTHPDWGPGGLIAYVQWTGEDSDIWVTDRTGSTPRLLVATPGIDTDPRWSPDGRTIVFTTGGGAENQDVVRVDSDGQHLELVAGGGGYEYAPSFTADGRRVLFVRDGAIFAIGADGEGEQRLTPGLSDTNPEISPNGRQLAFIRDGSLYLAAADGSTPRCVMTGQSIIGGPRWRP